MDSDTPYGGIDEPYEEDCIPYPSSEPGDLFPLDADVTIYWPRVRPVWEEDGGITFYYHY